MSRTCPINDGFFRCFVAPPPPSRLDHHPSTVITTDGHVHPWKKASFSTVSWSGCQVNNHDLFETWTCLFSFQGGEGKITRSWSFCGVGKNVLIFLCRDVLDIWNLDFKVWNPSPVYWLTLYIQNTTGVGFSSPKKTKQPVFWNLDFKRNLQKNHQGKVGLFVLVEYFLFCCLW